MTFKEFLSWIEQMHHLERFLIKEIGKIHHHLAVVRAAGLALPGYWQEKSCQGQDFVAIVL